MKAFRHPAKFLIAWIVALAQVGAVHADAPKKPELLVLAAASLTNVLDDLTADWQKTSGVTVKLSFAASSVLARQIEAGGKADVFVSADQEWMDYLQSRGLIEKPTRRNLVGNRLVLIAPADSKIELKIAPGFPLGAALGGGRLATGDPDTVPVGRYARAALISLEQYLNPKPGACADPGSGLDVAKFLAEKNPVCPVIVHTSNTDRAFSILNELRFADWRVDRVGPVGDRWIEKYWTTKARELLVS